MKVIEEKDDPQLFRQIEDRNLFAQYDFLRSSVDVNLLHKNFNIGHEIILRLHSYAVVHICDSAGRYRTAGVGINHSNHCPPPPEQVENFMAEYISYLNDNWEKKSAIHLAAYALWRMCWIHPFMEGNGRTSRAICCYVLCMKLGFWVPGRNTILKQIRDLRKPYYDALAEADKSDPRINYFNLGSMEEYLESLLVKQLSE
jgi:Fic family protein